MKRWIFFPATLILLLGLLLLAGTRVSAMMGQYVRSSNPFEDIPVTGEVNGSQFKGTMKISKFVAQGDGLAANITIDARMRNSDGEDGGHFSGTFQPVPVAVSASCESLRVTIKAFKSNDQYVSSKMKPVKVTLSSKQYPAQKDQFCAIAQKLNDGASQGDVADSLNDLLAAFE